MDKFQQLAVTTALRSMFEGKYFDICTIDKCLRITGCIPNRKDYDALSALHCIHFSNMEADLRDMVLLKTMQIFEQPGFALNFIDHILSDESRLLN